MIKCAFISIFKANGILSVDKYNDLRKGSLNWSSNNTEITSNQLFNDATYSFSEIVKSLSVRTIFEDANKEFKFRVDINETRGSIVEQRHRGFGRCYTYCPETSVKNLGVYYIKIKL